jgi:chemotaxis protein methyltransferase CheR
MLERARRACYQAGTLRELPERWRGEAFDVDGASYTLRGRFRQGVSFERRDLRCALERGPFDIVLCRNVAFTYFDEPLQRRIADRLLDELWPGGVLVVGNHEALPEGSGRARARSRSFYEKAAAGEQNTAAH